MTNSVYEKLGKDIITKGGQLSKSQREGLIALLNGFVEPWLPFPSYSVFVKYDQTVEQMIDANKYDWFNDDINSGRFLSGERGQVQVFIYLVNFGREISSEDAIGELDHQGLRPATLKELLALSASYLDLQRGVPIVALGSIWRPSDGRVEVPFLEGDRSDRYLDLHRWGDDWDPHWQFAAVRK